MLDFVYREKYGMSDLVEIMRLLRSEGGCPWDREQTHASIRRNLLEEAYEAAEAIDLGDGALLCEELGDVLLQVVFHARMEEEAGGFSIEDVADGVCKKLIERHPHIFGEVRADTAEQVLLNWDDIKRASKGQKQTADAMDSVARSLPALMRAEKIQDKAAKAGYDFSADEAMESGEVGDKLFLAVMEAREAGADPERELERATDRFIERFRQTAQDDV